MLEMSDVAAVTAALMQPCVSCESVGVVCGQSELLFGVRNSRGNYQTLYPWYVSSGSSYEVLSAPLLTARLQSEESKWVPVQWALRHHGL